MFGNEFSRRICCWRPKIHSSSKTGSLPIFEGGVSQKNSDANFCRKKVFRCQTWNVGDHLKRVFPKFQAKRSHPRGVNGSSKCANNCKKLWFWRQKMKCRESSETRFGKVWAWSEPCLRGKRPFKVCKKKSKFTKSIICWSLLTDNLSKIGFHKWSCKIDNTL